MKRKQTQRERRMLKEIIGLQANLNGLCRERHDLHDENAKLKKRIDGMEVDALARSRDCWQLRVQIAELHVSMKQKEINSRRKPMTAEERQSWSDGAAGR